MSLDNPGGAMGRLRGIEVDLAERQNSYEDAARQKFRLVREWEERIARCRLGAEGSDAEARKARALITAIEQDDLYQRLVEAEGSFAGQQAAIKTLEARAMIVQSVLKSQGRG